MASRVPRLAPSSRIGYAHGRRAIVKGEEENCRDKSAHRTLASLNKQTDHTVKHIYLKISASTLPSAAL